MSLTAKHAGTRQSTHVHGPKIATWGFDRAHLLDASLALREGDVPPRLVLNEFNLDFSTTGLLIPGPTLFVIVLVLVAGTVDRIVVLDEGVVADGREAVVSGVGTRTKRM